MDVTLDEIARVLAFISPRVGPLAQAENRAAFAELKNEALEQRVADLNAELASGNGHVEEPV